MTAENFAFWLKGYFELLSAGEKRVEKLVLTAQQVEMIETHLNYVFQEKPTIIVEGGLGRAEGQQGSNRLIGGPYRGGQGIAVC